MPEILLLENYLNNIGQLPTRWAKNKGLSPATVSRYLNGQDISFVSAQKISAATNGEVSVLAIMEKARIKINEKKSA